MKIQTYTISKQALLGMPETERDFFLLAGHFANEINFLSKVAIITMNNLPSDKIAKNAELAQALFFHKTLAGKLYEGWQMIQKKYYGTIISKDYDQCLDEDAQEAIKQANQYFSKNNLLRKVRNSYSFHYGPTNIELIINEMDDGDEMDMYIADQYINSLYYVSETIVNKAMLKELEPSDFQLSMDQLYDDIVLVHRLLLTFINKFMKVAASRHFEKSALNPISNEIDIGDLPNLEDLRIPFFVNSSSITS